MIIDGEVKSVELWKKNSSYKQTIKKNITVFKYAETLINELDKYGYIERLKNINQLGHIKVKKSHLYNRYQYVMLQYYLNYLARNVQNHLFSYTSLITKTELKEYYGDYKIKDENSEDIYPSIGEIIQMLIIITNIGHFDSTFIGLMGLNISFKNNEEFKNNFLNLFKDETVKELAIELIEHDKYYDYHLLNSWLILSSIKDESVIIDFSKMILINYIKFILYPDSIGEKSKHAFDQYRKIRNLSYCIYDLNVAPINLMLSIHNENEVVKLLSEYIDYYSDNKPVNEFINTLHKLLSDTVYHSPDNLIRQFKIAQRMYKELDNNFSNINITEYLEEILKNKDSILNRNYNFTYTFNKNQILKLKFNSNYDIDPLKIVFELNSIDFVFSSYYYRHDEIIVIVSISNNCTIKDNISFRILKYFVSLMYSLKYNHDHKNYLLISKYFLSNLFNHNIKINYHHNEDKSAVFFTYGNLARINQLKKYKSETKTTNTDKIHEIDWMIEYLMEKEINKIKDYSILIPASIVIKDDIQNKELNELDGLIIYPNRIQNQVIFFEAKNHNRTPNEAKNCLERKFRNSNIEYHESNFILGKKDAAYTYSVFKKEELND